MTEQSENLMDCRNCSRTVDCDAEFDYQFINGDVELFVCCQRCFDEYVVAHTYETD